MISYQLPNSTEFSSLVPLPALYHSMLFMLFIRRSYDFKILWRFSISTFLMLLSPTLLILSPLLGGTLEGGKGKKEETPPSWSIFLSPETKHF